MALSGEQAQREVAKLIGARPDTVILVYQGKPVEAHATVISGRPRPMPCCGRPFSGDDDETGFLHADIACADNNQQALVVPAKMALSLTHEERKGEPKSAARSTTE